jgi:hypothetical protein
MRRFVFALGVFVVALTVGVATATAAGGGNSLAAKLCQKNGWQGLVGSDGRAFASQDECVSFGAQNGTFRFSQSAVDCTMFGGTFVTNPPGLLWECIDWNNPDTGKFGPSEVRLAFDCQADGGTLLRTTGALPPGIDTSTCS